eukprot:189847-Chlamydomonas_euryale.AAC.3
MRVRGVGAANWPDCCQCPTSRLTDPSRVPQTWNVCMTAQGRCVGTARECRSWRAPHRNVGDGVFMVRLHALTDAGRRRCRLFGGGPVWSAALRTYVGQLAAGEGIPCVAAA